MSATPAKFNLRPQERRLMAVVAIVLFVVLNIWLVWPHWGDWEKGQAKRRQLEKTLATYSAEVAKIKAHQVKLRELESAGSPVVPDEQELDLVRTVDAQARLNKLTVIQSDPRPRVSANTQTNRFFEEQYETLHCTSDNEELINFLVSLASTNSLIRVKDLTLKVADAGATRLDGQMTLVASYQRTTPSRGTPAVVSPSTNVAAKTVATPAARNQARTNKAASGAMASNLTNRLAASRKGLTNAPAKKK